MTRSAQNKLRVGALAGLVMFGASACQIPVGNPLGLPLVQGCTIYLGEAAGGDIVIPVAAGTLELGCVLGL
ncbi:MAG: hypothetical protein GX868_12830 [Actinobacteria bacterium]|nr:hypothetical protein [Actinomycetota bacterium]